VMNPQGNSDDTRHYYFHKQFYLPGHFSVTDNFTFIESLIGQQCNDFNELGEQDCQVHTESTRQAMKPPPFHLVGKEFYSFRQSDLFGKEFYSFRQSDSNEQNFTFAATALDHQSTHTSLEMLVLRDVQGGQPIASSGIISPITLNGTVSTTIQLDQTRLQPVIAVGHEPHLILNGTRHKIKEGIFYNSHQWITPMPNTPTSNWIWFWLSLFDDQQTTVVICRLPPYAQHVATNVVTVSKLDNPDGMAPERHNRVFAGTHDVFFNATDPWISHRSNNTYYTQHHFRIFPAGLDLHIKAFVQDSEFGYRSAELGNHLYFNNKALPQVYYYEGAGKVWGTKHGKPVWGVGFIETFNNFYSENSPNYPPV